MTTSSITTTVAIERAARWYAANRDDVSKPVVKAVQKQFNLSIADAAKAISRATQIGGGHG